MTFIDHSRTRTLVATTTFALLALLLLHKCRRSPALCAHDPGSEYDRYVLWGCQPCDPRIDELQAWASLYERGRA